MESVGRLLWLTAKESREGLERRLQAAGGSMATWLILHALEDHEGNHQRELAEHLCLEGATVTRHLDRLEAEGLIERRPDALDRRGTCVYATPAGRRTLKKLWSVVSQAEADLCRGLTAGELDALRRSFARLRENLRAARAADRPGEGERPARPARLSV